MPYPLEETMMSRTSHCRPRSSERQAAHGQKGLTLIELMVGIAIGLLVIAVAMGALMASRGISGTVSDATLLQRQAAYAFRVMGQQIKQAGSLELSLDPNLAGLATSSSNAAMTPVAFDPPDPSGARPAFDRAASTIAGASSPVSITVGYQNYKEIITTSPTNPDPADPDKPGTPAPTSLLRDCLGQNPANGSGGSLSATPIISSQFQRNATTNELTCIGSGAATAQPVIGNVTDFQVRYITQAPNTTNMQYQSSPSAISDWLGVYAVDVCIELTGSEMTPTDTGATYKNCSGTDTAYGNRLKMVFHNVYQIRSQSRI